MEPITGRPARAPFRLLSIVPLALILMLAACSTSGSGVATIDRGGDAEGGDPTQTPAAATDFEEAFLAYTSCMRQNGIEMPDFESAHGDGSGSQRLDEGDTQPPPLPFDPESEEYLQADEICREHLAGVVGDGREDEVPLTEEEQEALLEYTECLRANGIDIADPNEYGEADVNTGVDGEPQPDAAPSFDEDAFRAADEACRELRSKLPQGDEEAAP